MYSSAASGWTVAGPLTSMLVSESHDRDGYAARGRFTQGVGYRRSKIVGAGTCEGDFRRLRAVRAVDEEERIVRAGRLGERPGVREARFAVSVSAKHRQNGTRPLVPSRPQASRP